MRFEYLECPSIPPLAWIAMCQPGNPVVSVWHGSRVETTAQWCCEAVWDGRFEEGDFDHTDIVSGSGIRLRDENVVFVSAGSTLEKLVYYNSESYTAVSNTLAGLLTLIGAQCDPAYRHYEQDFRSIIGGLDRYCRKIATDKGTVQVNYFENLQWDGKRLAPVAKPVAERDFGDFAAYRQFLASTFAKIADNMADSARTQRYEFMGTMSSGYDSVTVSVLAAEAGCREVISFDTANQGVDDSGAAIADQIGLTPHRIDPQAWRSYRLAEIPFVAANGMGEEVRFRGAEPLMSGRVLLTGIPGDKMWDKGKKNLTPFVRTDPAGLSLMEYRLCVGFLHCPVPFWGMNQLADLRRLSETEEMAPWDIGGDYNRPICRRIAEQAGVPREAFGIEKKGGSPLLQHGRNFLTEDSMADYLAWLKAHRAAWWRRGRIPPAIVSSLAPVLDRAAIGLTDRMAVAFKKVPGLWRFAHRLETYRTPLRRHIFPWAIERLQERYSEIQRLAVNERAPGRRELAHSNAA